MTNYIYITRDSKKELISNLQECKLTKKTINNTLIFKKIYPKISNILQTFFINDLSDAIMEYINDELYIKYMIGSEFAFRILIESIGNDIGLQEYDFTYALGVIGNRFITFLHVVDNNICQYQSGYIMDTVVDLNFVAVINEFMRYNYNIKEYIISNTAYVCNVINNDYVVDNSNVTFHQDDNTSMIFKISNKRKMKNMIVIIKIIYDIFKNIVL